MYAAIVTGLVYAVLGVVEHALVDFAGVPDTRLYRTLWESGRLIVFVVMASFFFWRIYGRDL